MAIERCGISLECFDHFIKNGHKIDNFELHLSIVLGCLVIWISIYFYFSGCLYFSQGLISQLPHQMLQIADKISQVVLLYAKTHDDLGN